MKATKSIRKSKAGVSETLGTILLLGITVTIFGVLYFEVTQTEWIHVQKPTPTIYGTVSSQGVVQLRHAGGLEVSKYIVLRNGIEVMDGDKWHIGDKLSVLISDGDSIVMVGDGEILMDWNNIHLPIPQPEPPVPPTNEELDVSSWTKTLNSTTWVKVGNIPYLGSKDYPTNYLYATNSEGKTIGYFNFENTTLSGTSFEVNISFWCWDSDGTGKFSAFINYTATGTTFSQIGGSGKVLGTHTTPSYETVDLGTLSLSKVNNLKIYLISSVSSGKQVYVDQVKLGIKVI